jgi:hypothetical protein
MRNFFLFLFSPFLLPPFFYTDVVPIGSFSHAYVHVYFSPIIEKEKNPPPTNHHHHHHHNGYSHLHLLLLDIMETDTEGYKKREEHRPPRTIFTRGRALKCVFCIRDQPEGEEEEAAPASTSEIGKEFRGL